MVSLVVVPFVIALVTLVVLFPLAALVLPYVSYLLVVPALARRGWATWLTFLLWNDLRSAEHAARARLLVARLDGNQTNIVAYRGDLAYWRATRRASPASRGFMLAWRRIFD